MAVTLKVAVFPALTVAEVGWAVIPGIYCQVAFSRGLLLSPMVIACLPSLVPK